MKSLKIAVVAHIRQPISEPFMGGMEAHAFHLVHGLKSRGHDVTLFAAGNSVVDVPLVPVVPENYEIRFPWHDYHGTDALNAHLDGAFAAVLPHLRSFDVIHNNSLHRYLPRFGASAGVPMLSSLHVPPFDTLRRAVHGSPAPWNRFTVCSNTQKRTWWPAGAPPEAHVVFNGIDLDSWKYAPTGIGTAVWAGRITPTKGTHLAIAAAKRAGMPLEIYGTIEHRDYFQTQIEPQLDQTITYGGHLSAEALGKKVSRASVFVFTPLWDEPFGLVAAEAMVCGTPVAALNNGAVPEVIHPECGHIARTLDAGDLARAMQKCLKLDRAKVSTVARGSFGLDRMLHAYENLYFKAINAAPTAPVDRHFSNLELPHMASLAG